MTIPSRARLLAACPDEQIRDGADAVKAATTACELTDWKNPLFLSTLAAAHAEAGEFDQAVEWQQKAIELSAGTAEQELRERLELFRQEQPYRLASGA